LVALSVAACGGGGAAQPAAAPTTASSTSTQATSAPPTKAPTPLPPTATPTTEPTAEPTLLAVLSGTSIDMNNPIFKTYFAVYNKFPRRMSAEVFDAATQKVTTVLIETDAKDHLRIETGGAAEAFSIIVISPTMYIKQGTTWMELPGAQSSMFLSMLTDADSLQQMLNAFDELASYTITPLGPDVINGTPAMAYASEFILKDGTSSKGKAWLGADGLLIQDRTETSSGMVITTTFDYDPSIKVEAPIP
jgi:hypothetical protein